MHTPITPHVTSDIGNLEAVILHSPGPEVENMTPRNAERALYSDILNLQVATEEYEQLSGVLNKLTRTFQVKELLTEVLHHDTVRHNLIEKICRHEEMPGVSRELMALSPGNLASQLIEGVALKRDSLTTFLSDDRYALRPLHNFFFTRDASVTIYDNVHISKMANKVREREALIMETIFTHSKHFNVRVVSPMNEPGVGYETFIEGGDVLVARHDILILGNGCRTSSQGIDFIAGEMKKKPGRQYLLIQQLPTAPESFIHLDMVFTLLNHDACMVYEPIISKESRYATLLMTIEGGKVIDISRQSSLPESLKMLGMDLKPIPCGGHRDPWQQEREQWHSGANFFALGPGKVMGYARNVHTLEEMDRNGYAIIQAEEVNNGVVNLDEYDKYVVTIGGSELSRGGGGARCMTMPVRRSEATTPPSEGVGGRL